MAPLILSYANDFDFGPALGCFQHCDTQTKGQSIDHHHSYFHTKLVSLVANFQTRNCQRKMLAKIQFDASIGRLKRWIEVLMKKFENTGFELLHQLLRSTFAACEFVKM